MTPGCDKHGCPMERHPMLPNSWWCPVCAIETRAWLERLFAPCFWLGGAKR